jgi:hypothetical protein
MLPIAFRRVAKCCLETSPAIRWATVARQIKHCTQLLQEWTMAPFFRIPVNGGAR